MNEVQVMRVVLAGISVVMMALPMSAAMAQAPAATAPAVAPPAVPMVSVSAQLQPALSAVMRTVNSLRIDKWKRGNIRDEAAQNVNQIQRDIDRVLPPMLHDADAAPANLTKLLPVSKNLGALYDVLLRVVEASRVVAPDDQVVQLQLAFDQRLQTAAEVMEKHVTELRATVDAQSAKIAQASAAAAVPCKPEEPKKTTRKSTTRRSTTKSTTKK
jgi:hypothetical protein